MSFCVPGEELDFAIYGDSNTNKLRLSPTQHHRLHGPKSEAHEGPDLTGYQSSIFENAQERKLLQENQKENKRSSIVFADQQLPPHMTPHLLHQPNVASKTSYKESGSQSSHGRSMRKPSRYGSLHMRIDTSRETLQQRQNPHPHESRSSQHVHARQEPSHNLEHEHHHKFRHQHRHCSHTQSPWSPSVESKVVQDQDHSKEEENLPADQQHLSLHPRLHPISCNDHHAAMHAEQVLESLAVEAALEITPAVTTLKPPIVRTATIVSATSSGHPRLTHRLSYLAHLQDLEAEEEEMESTESARSAAGEINNVSPDFCDKTPELSTTQPPPSLSNELVRSPPQEVSLPEAASPQSLLPRSRHNGKPSPRKVTVLASPPLMPSLYRRLLRVFKPPSDSSDSDGHAEAVSPSVAVSSARGPFGFPVNLESSLKGSSSSKTSPATRPAAAVIQNPDMTVNAAAPSHKPPQSTGFRARLLKKLLSSPNLNTVIYPAPAAAVKPHSYSTSVGQPHRQERRHYNDSDNSTAMHSTPPSEYEHDHTCPAGQRILEARNGAQRRAVTLPRQTVPPTLQSKYGVPGRELGAGTQAQVMLLRVKSTKRARASYPLSKKTEAGSEDAAQLKEQKQKEKPVVRGSLSPDDHDRQVPVDALLTPRCRSGTMLTTTEDDVTPEQREAYRKRLLRRFSTGGASVMSNGGGVSGIGGGGLIYAIKKFRPPKATETHRQYLKKICAEFCISTSMDHENIIRTIDLVRDQPEPDHVEDDIHDQEQETRRSRGHHQGQTHADHGYDPQAQWVGHEDVKDDNHDCNCSKGYHHVRAIKSDSRLRSDSQYESSSISSSSRHSRRTAIVANPQRKRSMETHSIPRRLVGTPEPASPHAQGAQEQRSRHSMLRSQHLPHMHLHRRQNKDQTEAQMITAAKKKKQLEQELRQKEVLRLKHLKDREKQRSKQLRLNQFPEYCMVMEFAAGGDLFSLLTKTDPPISLNEKHCLWRQLVNGVQYMHSMGVAHRDLKPENILIDGTGRILKITDFGIANVFKSVGDPNPLPCKGVIGSEPYIAPEEFYLEEYDPRAVDVWACGIIFYVMYYAAMPWARADRRKDARYARFIRDITAYRYNEPYRRLQFERRMLLNASTQVSKADAGSHTGSSHTSRSTVPSAEIFDRSQEANCRRQLPPYSPEESNISAGTSSQSGSPTSLHSQDDTVSPHTSVENSPVTTKKPMPFDTAQDLTMATNCTGTTSGSGESAMSIAAPIPATVYNTYAYNGHLGGHEFIDRMENPGCRRILYAILEPDVRKRVTIEQVVKDDWVARIRHCTDCVSKQEQQAALVFGRGTSPGKYMQGYGYGTPHHQHAVPKAVKH